MRQCAGPQQLGRRLMTNRRADWDRIDAALPGLLDSGLTDVAIAQLYDVHQTMISKRIRTLGLSSRRHYRKGDRRKPPATKPPTTKAPESQSGAVSVPPRPCVKCGRVFERISPYLFRCPTCRSQT